MSIEKMREEFEADTCSMLLQAHPDCGLTIEEIRSHRHGDEYDNSTWSMAWWAWQASRAALVVYLPPAPYMPDVEPADMTPYEIGEAQGRCDMWVRVRNLIEACGFKVQP